MLILFELKLIYFYDLSITTWLVIGSSFFAFLIGTITIFFARAIFKVELKTSTNIQSSLNFFSDDGKIIKRVLIIFSTIGLLSSIYHWKILLDKYDSIINVFLNSYAVYNSRFNEESSDVLPYVWMTSFIAIFIAGIYTAYKGKLTFWATIPIVAVVLRELARLTRSGILLGLLEFIISFLLFRHFLLSVDRNRFMINKKKIFIAVSLILMIMVAGASVVKLARVSNDEIQGTNRELKQFEGGAFISPAIYFYASSQIGVLNQYLEKDRERLPFGNSTFYSAYSLLSKLDLTSKPEDQHQGYLIPAWSNTGTFLRDLHGDFGFMGILIFPYLLGLLCSHFWFRLLTTHQIKYHILLTHLYLLIGMSFFILATRFPSWVFGMLILLLLFPIIEKFSNKYKT